MSATKKKVCEICKNETRGLRNCKDCDTVFCGFCLVPNTGGELIEITPHCPKCKSLNIIDIN